MDIFLKLVGTFGAWMLVVLGWSVVSDMADQRNRREKEETKIYGMRNELNNVEEYAINLHCNEYNDLTARKFARSIKGISLECSHLERIGVVDTKWRIKINNIRRAVTMNNFEQADHRALIQNDNLVSAIEASFIEFHSFLMKAVEIRINSRITLMNTIRRIIKNI